MMVGYWSTSKKTKKDHTNPSLLNKQPFPKKRICDIAKRKIVLVRMKLVIPRVCLPSLLGKSIRTQNSFHIAGLQDQARHPLMGGVKYGK